MFVCNFVGPDLRIEIFFEKEEEQNKAAFRKTHISYP